MLSKLLSNINAGKTTSGEDAVSGSGNKEGGMRSSEQVFKSLLQSLQNEGSSGKANQQLLALSENSSDQERAADEKNIRKNILGGSFTAMGEQKAGSLQQADQNILQELQKEFKNIKNEFTGDGAETSSEGEEKVNAETASETVSEENTDSTSSDTKQVEGAAKGNTNDNSTGVKITKETAENVEANQKGQVEDNGESNNSESEKKSVKKQQNAKAKPALAKQTEGNLVGSQKENTESANNRVDTDGEAPKGKEQKESESSSNSSESSPKNKQTSGTVNPAGDIKGAAQNGFAEKIPSEQGSKENITPQKGIEKQSQAINSENKLFEKRQHIAGRQVQPDAMGRPKEGQGVPKSPKINADSNQIDNSLNRGQTAKTELTEQQKKVMNSFFKRNSTTNISAKGLEMKGVQNAKDKKNGRGTSETENSQRGFGKRSATEGRNKLLSRLGISAANAQKQAKPLDLQNFSGVSVGQSDSSLEQQKINWEEQLIKTIDSSSEKESKVNSGSSSVRLGQMPITNVSLRKKILPGLTQRIQQAASSAKENGENWQKHNFTLDDGKNIQLSVRESKGVLQVKMGSMNLDLSKLLQQNLQQIREHLRQEFGTDIDLQFENQQQGEESLLAEDGESSKQKRNYRNNFAGEDLAAENAEDVQTKTVRNFGYNKMEWTA